MKKEEEIRRQILREACKIAEGTALGYHEDRLANELAVELLAKGLVMGSVSEYGTACITGIRDAGREYIDSQKPHKRVLAISKKIFFLLYSILLVALGYILNLDSVKGFLSDTIGKMLK
ncbi:MAG: hypothetical protein WCI03_04155 [bacterium]